MTIGAGCQPVHGLTNDRVFVVVRNPEQRFIANIATDGADAVRVVAARSAVIRVALEVPNHHIGTNYAKWFCIQGGTVGEGRRGRLVQLDICRVGHGTDEDQADRDGRDAKNESAAHKSSPKTIRSLGGSTDDFLPIPLGFSDADAFGTVLGRWRRLNRSVARRQEWAPRRNASRRLVPEWLGLDDLGPLVPALGTPVPPLLLLVRFPRQTAASTRGCW